VPKKTTKKRADARGKLRAPLEKAYAAIRDVASETSAGTNRRAAEALCAILNASLTASRTLDDDEDRGLRELEALRNEANASFDRLERWRASHVTAPKVDERVHFLQGLRQTLSSWRLPLPSAVRKRPPTLRDIAAQLARTIEQGQGRTIANEAGVILPTHADMADSIMVAWSRHVESHGEYHLGDSGSEAMIVDAFHAVGVPRRIADHLYNFEHRKKRHH
jgi:hypothetical protein